MDSKRKIHKHMIGTIKKTAIKLKISLKTEMKQQEYRALELKVQHNSKLKKNTPKLQIPHDMIPIAQYE